MARRRRQAVTFTISFLDVMCCAFGVMVLLFLVIKHNPVTAAVSQTRSPDVAGEVSLLQEEIRDGRRNLAQIRNTIDEVTRDKVTAEGLGRRIEEQLRDARGQQEATRANAEVDELAVLDARVRDLEEKKKQIQESLDKTGEQVRGFTGEGTRQYLTGLAVEGQRIVVLLDTSASMLDETLVNVIRRRNMTDNRRTASDKWRQAVATLDWLTTRFPAASNYQVYFFNTTVTAAIPGSEGQWLPVSDAARLDAAVDAARKVSPEGGTSLHAAFQAVARLRPLPDNLYLITDGLPTQGQGAPRRGGKVNGNERLKLFNAAAAVLPDQVTVSTILLPLEGDPMAAFSYWGLAVATGGSLLSPASDWP